MTTLLFITPTSLALMFFTPLQAEHCEAYIANDIRSIKAHLEKHTPLAIFSRPQLPGYRAEELFTLLESLGKNIPVIITTDIPSVHSAEKYMAMGAYDFWEEPMILEKVLHIISHRKQQEQSGTDTNTPTETTLGTVKHPIAYIEPIGDHPAIKRVSALARRVATSKATVLLNGESGTGKEVFAKYVHAISDRADKPFIAVNCAALPEHLLESELFGHEKGSFTGAITKKLGKFELAHGGTILLDEISEMAIGLQAKLLRVLQEGEIDRVGGGHPISVDVRVLATTNRNLEEWVAQGNFRQDLYFRLNVIPLTLPPLRERGSDIDLLAKHFLAMYAKEYALPHVSLSKEAKLWLSSYEFMGNVRELQNLIERAVLLSSGGVIEPHHFLIHPDSWAFFEEESQNATPPLQRTIEHAPITPQALVPLHEMERIMILKGLESTSGNRTHAADLLGISVRTLRNKINEYRASGYHIE